MNIIVLIISLMVAAIGLAITILDYRRSKVDDLEAIAVLGKRIVGLALVVAVLNFIVPLISYFKPPPSPATKAQIEKLFVKYIGEKPKNPPVKEVKIEIEKELQAAFKKKEDEALKLYDKGNAAYDNNQFKEAISFFSAALEIVKTASFHLARGNSYVATSDFKLALQDYEVALLHYKNSENRQGEGNSLFYLGSAYCLLCQHDKAINYLNRSLVIAREIGDRKGEGSCLGNLGNVYGSLGQYDKAIEYHRQAIAIAREIGGLGFAYDFLGQYDKAIEYCTQALEIFEEIKSPQADFMREKIAELETEKD